MALCWGKFLTHFCVRVTSHTFDIIIPCLHCYKKIFIYLEKSALIHLSSQETVAQEGTNYLELRLLLYLLWIIYAINSAMWFNSPSVPFISASINRDYLLWFILEENHAKGERSFTIKEDVGESNRWSLTKLLNKQFIDLFLVSW